jgi:hypothetical protein
MDNAMTLPIVGVSLGWAVSLLVVLAVQAGW